MYLFQDASNRMPLPKPRKVKVWVFLIMSLILALVLLALELRVLSLFMNPNSFNGTLYDLAIFPSWALNAFPAGYILRRFGLRVYGGAPTGTPIGDSSPLGQWLRVHSGTKAGPLSEDASRSSYNS